MNRTEKPSALECFFECFCKHLDNADMRETFLRKYIEIKKMYDDDEVPDLVE